MCAALADAALADAVCPCHHARASEPARGAQERGGRGEWLLTTPLETEDSVGSRVLRASSLSLASQHAHALRLWELAWETLRDALAPQASCGFPLLFGCAKSGVGDVSMRACVCAVWYLRWLLLRCCLAEPEVGAVQAADGTPKCCATFSCVRDASCYLRGRQFPSERGCESHALIRDYPFLASYSICFEHLRCRCCISHPSIGVPRHGFMLFLINSILYN